MSSFVEGLATAAKAIIAPVANLSARIYVGLVFFQSGLSKVEDWQTTLNKFQTEWALSMLSSGVSAWLATAGEIVFSIMLIIGFFTRFSACGLLIMVLIIEFVIFNGASVDRQYYYWMLIFGFLVGYGGDKLSIDAFLSRKKDRRF